LKIKSALMVGLAALSFAGTIETIPAVHTDAAARVWIAPNYGKRYHFNRNCRGLYRAKNHVRHVTLHYAKAHHYTHCRISGDRY
jgi:hypothetical protein